VSDRATWAFEPDDEIVPGRHAVRLLGGGSRYEAYLAWDEDLHALAVAKLVRPDRVSDARTLAALATEAAALAALAHPAIVRAFDVVPDGDRPHLLLEYLEGPRLSTLLRRYGLALEQVLPLALQLASALHYIGRRGMVHLDVKPRNVVMPGSARLIDFSVARPAADVSALAGLVGTDAYMAPEQCDPDRFGEIGPPSDVWGLGVTLYEAIARRKPFGRGDRGAGAGPARFPQLVDPPAPLPEDVPEAVAGPVLACLDPDPAGRPSAAELSAELEPLVDALPPPRLGKLRPGWRQRLRELR
jgi:eukaryotic-like serine/threonine-protein kinase